MPVSVTMPALGESVTEGTITRWLKKEGEHVDVDEPLLEISTDKVDTEIPSPVAGTLGRIIATEDTTVEVGGELAIIATNGSAATPSPASTAPQPPAPQQPAPVSPSNDGQSNGAYVTPLVRKLAAANGVDLATIRGTGVGGRIRKQDIVNAAQSAATPAVAPSTTAPAPASKPADASPLRGKTEKLSRLRMVVARRMVESLQTAAQLTTVVEVDVSAIARLREESKADFLARHGVKLSFLPFFSVATLETLREYPRFNATIDLDAGTITYPETENLGVAVDTERGLIVPVIRDAGDLNLGGVARKIADLAERTRNNKLHPDELAGGTFTITNTGSRGALFDTPIINQPQSAILGTGTVVKRAVVVEDANLGEIILPRSMMYLSLTYDHRVVDGADAARFLVALKDRLEHGTFDVS